MMLLRSSLSAAALRVLAGVVLLFCAAPAAAPAQGKTKEEVCPYCKNDPKVLEAAGLVTHGNMPFGKTTSDDVVKLLFYTHPIFLESKHFRVGSLLESFNIPEKDWKKYAAEMEQLRKVLPTVPAKPKTLDPWLRLHLFAYRCEQRYERFLQIVQHKEEDFPDKRQYGSAYMGEGRYLGMKEKIEVFFHKDVKSFMDYLRESSGSTTRMTKREHYVKRGALAIVIPVSDDLRNDMNLYAHLSHNLGHQFLDGYKHYSYDRPRWFAEGFAHVYEKEVSLEYNSFDSEEAAADNMYQGDDWWSAVIRIIDRKKAASMGELIHKDNYSQINKEDHLIVWSKVDFMMQVKPGFITKYFDALCGRLNKEGYADSTNPTGVQRECIKKELGWTLEEFDVEWEKWVRKVYPTKKP